MVVLEQTDRWQPWRVAWEAFGPDARRMRAPRRAFCLGIALSILGLVSIGNAQVSREYQLKAAFLFHFAQFTEWPTNTFQTPTPIVAPALTNGVAGRTNITAAVTNEPLVIGVLGIDPFGSALDSVVEGERVSGRRLVVERYRRVEEAKSCHILFIAQSESRRIDAILDELRGKPVLTVSDVEGAAYRGMMISMYTEQNRIRLRINVQAVSQSGLTLSSKLLRAADLVPRESSP